MVAAVLVVSFVHAAYAQDFSKPFMIRLVPDAVSFLVSVDRLQPAGISEAFVFNAERGCL
jgi:hypothetical protein